jgi:hypothetical protein
LSERHLLFENDQKSPNFALFVLLDTHNSTRLERTNV